MSLGLLRPYLLSSPGFAAPPINWRWVENEGESTCSQVATMERLLHKALASVRHDILHLVWVSLRKKAKIQPVL
jgi:hypothetical protein